MIPEHFRSACVILWGLDYRQQARAFLGVSDRNLSRFCSGAKEVGPDFEADLLQAIRDRAANDPTPIIVVLRKALEPANA